MEWMLAALRRYADFEGRSRRKEYWMFILLYLTVFIAAAAVDYLLGYGTASASIGDGRVSARAATYGPVELFVIGALFVPGLAVLVRRLHDTDRRGWWVLVSAIPLIGSVILLVWLCTDGTEGPNRFGGDPKLGDRGGVRRAY